MLFVADNTGRTRANSRHISLILNSSLKVGWTHTGGESEREYQQRVSASKGYYTRAHSHDSA